MRHLQYWIPIYALCLISLCQAQSSTINPQQRQQLMVPPPTNPQTKTTTKLLPIGDALVFASIGSGLVVWMRKQKKL